VKNSLLNLKKEGSEGMNESDWNFNIANLNHASKRHDDIGYNS
jgi:hypothetical protein